MKAPVDAGLSRLFGSGIIEGVVSAYVFGSHARGESHRESDVDVGVLVNRDRYPSARERGDLRVLLSSEVMGALGTNAVDVIILNDVPPTLGRHVVTEGRRVFCADPEGDHAFTRDVQLRAADLAPFLKKTRRIKLEAFRR